MTKQPAPPAGKGYEVGYGRPPKDTQFRKGKSGNPAGRPRGAKNKPKLTGGAINDVLRRELGRTVEIRGADGLEMLSIVEATTRSLGVQAMKGNVRAQQHVIALQRELDAQAAADLEAHDRELLALRASQLQCRRLNRERGIEEDLVPDPDHIVMDRTTGHMIIRGPADLQQKVEWDRMWGSLWSFRWEIERAKGKLSRLRPQHAEEERSLHETIDVHEYYAQFYAMRLMTLFSLEAWQVTKDSFEQRELEQRIQKGFWPEPPAEVRQGLTGKELEALRRGEIYRDIIIRRERWRGSALDGLRSRCKPAAQVAFERKQKLRNGWGTPAAVAKDTSAPADPGKAAPIGPSWIDQFSLLRGLSADIRAGLDAAGTVATVPAGERVFKPDDASHRIHLILSGRVRVKRPPEEGRSIPAFYLGPGALSVLILCSTMELEEYDADGIAEEEVTAVAIPIETFIDIFRSSPSFRMFVCER
jgi:hypothetical protein